MSDAAGSPASIDEAPAADTNRSMRSTIVGWLRRIWDVLKRTYTAWRADRTLRLGAGLAYYALFTLAPFLAITLALSDLIIGEADLAQYLSERLETLGVNSADLAADDLAANLSTSGQQASLGAVGLISLLFAASVLFLALTDAINTIWGAPVRSGWWNTIRRRLISFLMVLISSAAIVLQFAVAAVAGAAQALVPGEVPVLEDLSVVVASGAAWLFLFGIVVLLFRFLSPQPVPWRVAIPTGVLTAVLLVAGTAVVGTYLRRFGGGSVAGAFGAILAVLTWVYVEAQILLAGVQLSKVLTRDAAVDQAP